MTSLLLVCCVAGLAVVNLLPALLQSAAQPVRLYIFCWALRQRRGKYANLLQLSNGQSIRLGLGDADSFPLYRRCANQHMDKSVQPLLLGFKHLCLKSSV